MNANAPAVNAVYYPSRGVYHDCPPSKLPVNSITHVFYAFASPNGDGTLSCKDKWIDDQMPVDGEMGCLRALAKLKKQHRHLTTILSVGGGGRSKAFPAVAAGARTRVTFATSVRKFIDDYSLDGVDIDWEHPTGPSEAANFLYLLQMLRTHLPEPQYLLTAALPVDASCLANVDLAAASHVLDFLNLMGYDLAGPWSAVAGHHAQLLPGSASSLSSSSSSSSSPSSATAAAPPTRQMSCHLGVDYVIGRGFPRRKILLGIPVFARCFPGALGPGRPFEGGSCAEMKYRDLPEKWIADAAVDAELGAASFVDKRLGGLGFVSFDVPATVRQKAGYAMSMGLGGLFYWNELGDVDGPGSLVVAGRKGLDEL